MPRGFMTKIEESAMNELFDAVFLFNMGNRSGNHSNLCCLLNTCIYVIALSGEVYKWLFVLITWSEEWHLSWWVHLNVHNILNLLKKDLR